MNLLAHRFHGAQRQAIGPLLLATIAVVIPSWTASPGLPAGPVSEQHVAPEAAEGVESLVRRDHRVQFEDAELHTWEVSLEAPDGHARPVVFFLHGGTWSGRPNFDLRYGDYSTMERFARAGWRTFAFDARGYGLSSDPDGAHWSEAKDTVRDLHAVVTHLLEGHDVSRVSFVGWSWGSQVAALFAQQYPDLTGRVVLYGTRWKAFEDAPDAPEDRMRTNTLDDAKSDFVDGCFEPALMEAYAKAAFAADPASPNGVFRDYFVNLPIIDPKRLQAPTLLIAGEHEAAQTLEDLQALFAALPTPDRQLAIIPGGGHAVHLEKGRHRWYSTVMSFLRE
ncbi:MAG: alpha/beta fold hydrolase [Planctomycetota bacterium]